MRDFNNKLKIAMFANFSISQELDVNCENKGCIGNPSEELVTFGALFTILRSPLVPSKNIEVEIYNSPVQHAAKLFKLADMPVTMFSSAGMLLLRVFVEDKDDHPPKSNFIFFLG